MHTQKQMDLDRDGPSMFNICKLNLKKMDVPLNRCSLIKCIIMIYPYNRVYINLEHCQSDIRFGSRSDLGLNCLQRSNVAAVIERVNLDQFNIRCYF